ELIGRHKVLRLPEACLGVPVLRLDSSREFL
ncbi:unnamed protein product, partial [marine sediment metagenome]